MASNGTRQMETKPDQLTFLFCANARFFRHFAVALSSLIQSNPQSFKKVFLATCDADPQGEQRLRELVARDIRTELEILRVPSEIISGLYTSRHLSAETYLRISAPSILPADIGRVLYLDCDLIVVDDLRPLWQTDLADKALAAAPDYPWYPEEFRRSLADQIGFPADRTYVNVGVALLNLDYWREHSVSDRLFEFARERQSDLMHHDQDAINVVLQDEIKLIDYRWNVQAPIYYFRRHAIAEQFDGTSEARRRPAIIHYSGSQKPWGFRARVPRKAAYLRHAQHVVWPPIDDGATVRGLQRLELLADQALARRGIDYMQAFYLLRRLPQKVHQWALAQRRSAADPSRAAIHDTPEPAHAVDRHLQ